MKRCKYEKSNKRYNVLDINEKTYIAVNAENRASKVDLKLILAEKFRKKKDTAICPASFRENDRHRQDQQTFCERSRQKKHGIY